MDKRNFKFGFLIVFGMGVLVGMFGSEWSLTGPVFAKTPEVITAEKFVLVDQTGKTRAALHMTLEGKPRLDLYDEEGRARVGIYLLKNGLPRLGLFDEEGMHRALIALLPSEQPGLIFFDDQGNPQMSLMLTPQHNPQITLSGRDGKVLWSAP